MTDEVDRRKADKVPTRELLARNVGDLRRIVTRIERLALDIGVNTPTPPEVSSALETLRRWTADIVRAGKPRRPHGNSGP